MAPTEGHRRSETLGYRQPGRPSERKGCRGSGLWQLPEAGELGEMQSRWLTNPRDKGWVSAQSGPLQLPPRWRQGRTVSVLLGVPRGGGLGSTASELLGVPQGGGLGSPQGEALQG